VLFLLANEYELELGVFDVKQIKGFNQLLKVLVGKAVPKYMINVSSFFTTSGLCAVLVRGSSRIRR
jgi:hypothetical protein